MGFGPKPRKTRAVPSPLEVTSLPRVQHSLLKGSVPENGAKPSKYSDAEYMAEVARQSTKVGIGYNKGTLEVITDIDTLRNNGRGR